MNKIKLVKVSSYYSNYLQEFETQPVFQNISYQEGYSSLMNDCFGWSDFWKTHLENTGQFEVIELVANAGFLQKQWAFENKITYRPGHWEQDILEAQIIAHNPDILFAHDFGYIDNTFRTSIRRKVPNIKKIICWDGIAINDVSLFQGCDIMLSCLQASTDYYNKNGIHGYTFHYGFETSINEKIQEARNLYEVSFIGGISLFEGGHHNRIKILSALCWKTQLNLFLSGNALIDWPLYKWPQRQRILKGKIKEAFQIYQLGKNNQGETFGLKMFQTLADSNISLNVHIDRARDKAANIRLFEATGVGTCLLTDWKDNINDYFVPDVEVVTFRNVNEAMDKIRFLRNNEGKRNEIALAGQAKTLKHYSLKSRINTFLPFLLGIYYNN